MTSDDDDDACPGVGCCGDEDEENGNRVEYSCGCGVNEEDEEEEEDDEDEMVIPLSAAGRRWITTDPPPPLPPLPPPLTRPLTFVDEVIAEASAPRSFDDAPPPPCPDCKLGPTLVNALFLLVI